jgi:subtilisin family serine protease
VVCLAASTAAISAGSLAPSAAQPQQDTSFTVRPIKSRLGLISATDPGLLGRTDSTPINVVVKLDYDAAASYLGNIPGLAATSPRKTGRKLKDNKAAVDAYVAWATSYESQVLGRVRARIPAAQVRQSFRAVYGGVSMMVPANAIAALLSIDGVVAVQLDSLAQPLTSVTPDFVGASDVWPSLGGSTKAGEGVIVGILDTGIWPEHPSFADHGLAPPPGGPYQCRFGGASGDPAFACNKKLIGAYAFLNTYLSVYGNDPAEFCVGGVCSARDAEGHGTHTSSTAAGGPVDNATLLGVNRGHASGMAPGAHVIMYRVCRVDGCFGSDSVAAVNQAMLDGVDVLNFSISGGADAYTDPVELAFLDAYEAGIIVNASAGNNGPGAATANHAGPWTNTVAASTSNRHYFSTLRLTAANGDTLSIPGGVTVTAGVTNFVVVMAPAADPLCQTAAAPGTYTGKVVVCQRGVNARVDKGYNVLQGGAAGMILYNPAIQQLNSDNHWLPAIHVEGPSTAGSGGPADRLLSFLSSHTGVTATWTNGVETTVRGDVTASFSSRGPLGDFIKPDVTAPGVQVLAGHSPQPVGTVNGPPGQLFQAIAGTSMSSPHAAGVAALVKAAHPSWTPGQIKSALMTSSVQDVLKEDGVTPATPFDRGAGSVRANRAVNPTVTFDVGSIDYVASALDPLGRVDLNLPSVNAPTMAGEITTWRTMRNVTGEDQPLDVSVQAPAGAAIIVAAAEKKGGGANKSDKTIGVDVGAERLIQITIKAPGLANGQYFGQITLTPKKKGYSPVVIPVAFDKRQGQVSLAHSCAPSSFSVAGGTTCTVRAENFSPGEASVAIEVDASKGLEYSNVSAPGKLAGKDVITWSGTLIAPQPPQIDIAVAPGSTPAGFLPLSLFGITPIAGVGDETIANFNVPTFSFGAETYSRIGIVSNGYIVIGGGDSGDVNYINQSLPNPTRPNNVLAPFWTDLNPGAAGAVRIATLTDGVSTWLVIEFNAVREFSTASKTVSFQTWIKLGNTPASEEVTIAYGPIAGGANGDGGLLTVGAENRAGTSGRNLYYNGAGTLPVNGTELKLSSVPPSAGGAVQFSYGASAKKTGSYTSTANLLSDATPGITQDVETLTVTP